MLRMYDYRCQSCNELEEHLTKPEDTQQRCNKCGGNSVRVISGTRPVLDPVSGDFPGATLAWARHHEKMAKAGSRAND